LEEKSNTYFKAPSGIPSIQHSLQAMLEFYHDDKITIEQIVEKMCHGPARLFGIKDRGFIRPGYWADLILVDLEYGWYVLPDTIIHKCKWSSFVNYRFRSMVTHTFVNGTLVYLGGTLMQKPMTMPLEFTR
jgi:dihydroorotase